MEKEQNPIRVFVADDHAIERNGLRYFVESFNDCLYVGEAGDGLSAVKGCAQSEPDIVLMDLKMPIMNGIDATRMICKNNPNIQVIILDNEASQEWIMDALLAGAVNCINKDISAIELAKAIRRAYTRKNILSTEATHALIDSVVRIDKPDYAITPREYEVLDLLVKGFRNREIAEKLFISDSTVRNHASKIFKKLNVSNRTEAVAFALQQDIIY